MGINNEREHILRDVKNTPRSAEWPYDSEETLSSTTESFSPPWEDEETDFRLTQPALNPESYPYDERDAAFGVVKAPVKDRDIKARILEFLSRDSSVSPHQIEVKVAEGDVTLEGWVSDHWMKLLVEGLTEQIPGVGKVINRIQVDPDPDHHPF
jgi:hypothetical protein